MDFFSAHLGLLWTLLSIVLFITELTTGGFYLMCLAFGSLLVAVLSVFVDSITAQIVVFCFLSVLSVVLLRPVLVARMHSDAPARKSNIDALVGQPGIVSVDIPSKGFGRVAAGGDDWRAVSSSGSPIAKGSHVRVVAVDSLTLSVVLDS